LYVALQRHAPLLLLSSRLSSPVHVLQVRRKSHAEALLFLSFPARSRFCFICFEVNFFEFCDKFL